MLGWRRLCLGPKEKVGDTWYQGIYDRTSLPGTALVFDTIVYGNVRTVIFSY